MRDKVERYLRSLMGDVRVLEISEMGGEKQIKAFGYGKPYLIRVIAGDKRRDLVLSTMPAGQFGHERMDDRAAILLWQHRAFNSLPKHVRSIDVGFFTHEGEMRSAGNAEEFFILMERGEGDGYWKDLERIRDHGMVDLDQRRVIALSNYLAEIHGVKRDDRGLYIRRIRELLGHGECIFGLCDSYPDGYAEILERVEKRCVEWRWKLRNFSHRLSQVHGDFHPWNILFKSDTDFVLLDRSRGEWGDPADDLSSITINYLMYSLLKDRRICGDFLKLYNLFFDNYLDKTGDEEILKVIQPFYTFRALVVASPIWYPNHPPEVREMLLNFAWKVLEDEEFDRKDPESYMR